jgi:hypothetical protein
MSLREFIDDAGREWRAWDVKEENIHKATRNEDYMRDYLDGWVAFESFDGEAKCRLHPIPRNWEDADREQLVKWLHAAEPIRGDRTSGAHGRTAAETVAKLVARRERPRGTARTFRFPAGRFWSVAEWTSSDDGQGDSREHAVLRFTSGMRSLDLTDWPDDWNKLNDEQLAMLLARAFPRPTNQRNPTDFRRRGSDEHPR